MYTIKRFAIFIFTGCLLLFASVFLSSSVYEKTSEMNGQVSLNKVTISIKDNELYRVYFNLEDVENLKKSLDATLMVYAAQEKCFASYENNSSEVKVTGINELAPMFENIRITSGSFFSESDCREKSRVIVIDDDMAWKLFNNDKPLGCNVNISGIQFKIIGITKSDKSIVSKLTDDGSVKVYIPVQTYLEINKDIGVFYLQYKTETESATGKNMADIKAALTSIGKDPANYNITDYNIKRAIMEQKPGLLLFCMGLLVILALLVSIVKYVKKTILDIRNGCKTDYLANVAASYRFKILKILIMLILSGTASVIIWRLTRFDIFIPPDLIPDDFTDISYYIGLLLRKASQSFSGDVYMVPFQEMELNAAESILNWIFYTGCFAGILLFYTALSWLGRINITAEKASLICGSFLIADLGIFALLAHLAGLPIVIDLKGLILFWSFVFTNLLIFLPEVKEVITRRIETKDI